MPRVRLRPAVSSAQLPIIDLAAGEVKTLGRASHADIVVDDPSLSRVHARLSLDASGALTIEDLGSTNGVVINGTRTATATLAAGDRVRFGFVEYVVSTEADAAAAASLAPSIVRVPISHAESAAAGDHAALEALLALSRELMAFSDLPALLEHVLDRLHEIVKPDRSAILLVDSSGTLTPRAVRPRGAYTSVSEFASSTVVREALGSRDVLLIHDAAQQERLQHAASLLVANVHSVICVPLYGRSGAIGALYADRIGLGRHFTPALAEVAGAFGAHAASALETAKLYDDREQHFRATLEAFARAIDARDPYTAGHSERVTAYTLMLARHVGLAGDELETIRRAGMLHDIGKVGVRDAILLKAGALDPDERAAMEAHPLIGYRMLEGLPFLADALPSVRGHHERWDGNGYPDRLAGTNIHRHARLMAVADTYDAMTSARPYRGALPRDEAKRRIAAEPGRQFDPEIVDAFLAVEAQFDALRAAAPRPSDVSPIV